MKNMLILFFLLFNFFLTSSGYSMPPFKKAFESLYLDGDESSSPKLSQEVSKVKCNLCHIGSDRKQKNDYGTELGKLLNKKDKDQNKIKAAIKKIETKSPKESRTTYGQLIKQGRLNWVIN